MIRASSEIGSITDDRRCANYPWATKDAAAALDVHPNKVGDWVYRTEEKLVALMRQHPGETLQFFAAIVARASRQ